MSRRIWKNLISLMYRRERVICEFEYGRYFFFLLRSRKFLIIFWEKILNLNICNVKIILLIFFFLFCGREIYLCWFLEGK